MGARLSCGESAGICVAPFAVVPDAQASPPVEVCRCSAPAQGKPVRKGILKPRSAVAPPRRGAGTCDRRRPARVGARGVSWLGTVRITEFSRALDGGCGVPADGSIISLGLGKPLRQVLERLAGDRQAGKAAIEETRWVPEPQRVKLLRKAMGEARFYRALRPYRHETRRLLAAREVSKRDEKDKQLMPESFVEALSRAQLVQEEAAESLKDSRDARIRACPVREHEAARSPGRRISLSEVDRLLWSPARATPPAHSPARRLQFIAA